jgi:hypothetical protein
MRLRHLLPIMTLLSAAGAATAGVVFDVSYDFEPGATSKSHLAATIDSVEMGQDVPLAVTGSAEVDLTLEALRVDDGGVATVRASFGEVQATLLEEPQEASTPAPVDLRIDGRGALVGLSGEQSPEINLFASGGVPLQMVVLLAGVVEMPAQPVGIGETWSTERSQQIPQVGEITMVATSRITQLSEQQLTVVTDIEASLPDFTTANPLQDADVTVQNGVLSIQGMRRTLNVETGLIAAAEAQMKFDGMAAFGPFPPMPLAVTSSFSINPIDAPDADAEGAGAEDDG